MIGQRLREVRVAKRDALILEIPSDVLRKEKDGVCGVVEAEGSASNGVSDCLFEFMRTDLILDIIWVYL